MLLDANLLLYAVHKGAEQHEAAARWLTEQINGARRVGLPWQSLGAFLRTATHPRAFQHPSRRRQRGSDWLAAPAAWIPEPGPEHARILGELTTTHDTSATSS